MAETSPIDAKEIQPCFFCRQGVMHTGSPVFYELTFASCAVDIRAVQQLAGMEAMMGNAAIARAMAPSTTVAHRITPSRHLICSECAADRSVTSLQFLGDDHG